MRPLLFLGIAAVLAASGCSQKNHDKPPPAEAAAPAETGGGGDGGGRGGVEVQTLDQMLQRARARFAKLDANKDGKLTQDELDQAESDGDGPGAGGLRMIERADANGDGVVTAQELDDQVRARFKAMDTNGDGKVTPEERRAAFQKRRQGDGG